MVKNEGIYKFSMAKIQGYCNKKGFKRAIHLVRKGKCRYTPPQKSYGQVIDMRCQVNSDTRCLTHQNFWYLGRSRRLCASMDMLPLMVLAPVYGTLLRNHAMSYKMLVDAHLDQKCCPVVARSEKISVKKSSTSMLSESPTSLSMLGEKGSCTDTLSSDVISSGTIPSCQKRTSETLPCGALLCGALSCKKSACISLSCSLVFPGKITQGLSESEAQQFGKLVQFYDRDAQLLWKPTYKHRILLLYREDFMREMLGLFSWIDFKVRLWSYKTLKSVKQWFAGEQHC